MHTVNDQLSALGAYLKTKAFGWALIWIGHLIRAGRLSKNKKNKNKNSKKYPAINPSKIIFKINQQNPAFISTLF